MDYRKLHKWSLENELLHPEYAELMSELRFTFYEHQSVDDCFTRRNKINQTKMSTAFANQSMILMLDGLDMAVYLDRS